MLQSINPKTGNNLVIVVNDNSYGLSRDARILQVELESFGWSVTIADTKGRTWSQRMLNRRENDVVIHLETCHRKWIGAGKIQILIPNPEWYHPRLIRKLRSFDLILTKTLNATEIFRRHSNNVRYLGFTSQDMFSDTISKKWNSFFHLAGASSYKGTEDILTLWNSHPEWPELVLIQRAGVASSLVPENVTLITERLDESVLRNLQNAHALHLCPSRYEGWGHHLIEAMSCGATILTTDAPPMNEFISMDRGILVPYDRSKSRKMANLYFVELASLEVNIKRMIEMQESEKAKLGRMARQKFLEIDARFHNKMIEIFT